MSFRLRLQVQDRSSNVLPMTAAAPAFAEDVCNAQAFTTPGTSTCTMPDIVDQITVTVIGAGG
ncbi:hypothetical protein IPZ70_20995, partial [Streptomyces polychromogenes]|nr:hypothetical protein [Streptomyces polychromogenes]